MQCFDNCTHNLVRVGRAGRGTVIPRPPFFFPCCHEEGSVSVWPDENSVLCTTCPWQRGRSSPHNTSSVHHTVLLIRPRIHRSTLFKITCLRLATRYDATHRPCQPTAPAQFAPDVSNPGPMVASQPRGDPLPGASSRSGQSKAGAEAGVFHAQVAACITSCPWSMFVSEARQSEPFFSGDSQPAKFKTTPVSF